MGEVCGAGMAGGHAGSWNAGGGCGGTIEDSVTP